VHQSIIDYYRCPEDAIQLEVAGDIFGKPMFFQFAGSTCYGRYVGNPPGGSSSSEIENASIPISNNSLQLPFDFTEVVDNLRHERYKEDSRARRRLRDSEFVSRAYYRLRPLLPQRFRKYLHRIHLDGWREITFPFWPIDTTVDHLMETSLRLALQARPGQQIPFIWFWPEGYPACALMTHDVEEEAGREFCLDLLAIDESYGIKSSFQIVPEGRYDAGGDFIESIKSRGFEVNVHDLNHDGHLFKNRRLFLERAAKINEYRENFGAEGFRSGSMYRKAEWLPDLAFAYDMSIPNAAHLEPQQGGCCTVMPFKLGHLVELPLTVTQDYALFRIFEDYSMDLWEREIQYLLRKHALINIIVHPDYIIDRRARNLYCMLLQRLADLRDRRKLWVPLPRDAARWWNMRSRMRLKQVQGKWNVIGEGSENARVAQAYLDNGRLFYKIGNTRLNVPDEVVFPEKTSDTLV
jgi:hypothetical protein